MPVNVPGAAQRWRCGVCGNLTRFDVVRLVRSRDYVHVELSGEPRVEERQTLAETVEHVTCRWCGVVDGVVLEPRPAARQRRSDPAPGGSPVEPLR
jgi:hypothetical protein